MQLPKNLPLLMSMEPDENAREFLSTILKDPPDHLTTNLLALISKYWKIKIWFDKPVTIYRPNRWVRKDNTIKRTSGSYTTTEHVFNKIFVNADGGCGYCPISTGKHGYDFNDLFHSILKWEPLPYNKKKETTYEDIQRKIVPYFIDPQEVQKRWKSKPLRRFTNEAKKTLKDFLVQFKGINYLNYPEPKIQVTEYYTFRRHDRRCRTFTHNISKPYVIYEYDDRYGHSKCGLVININEFLPLD